MSGGAPLPTPTVGPLLYLFADELLAGQRWVGERFTGRSRIPCRDVGVRDTEIAKMILAAALWSLREQGHIEIELAKRGRRVFAIPREHHDLPGIDGQLLTTITSSLVRGKADVSSVVYGWLGGERYGPTWHVIDAAIAELESLGYFTRTERVTKVLGFLRSRQVHHEPDCDQISRLRPAYGDLSDRWRSFLREEPELSSGLIRSCSAGIKRAEPRPMD